MINFGFLGNVIWWAENGKVGMVEDSSNRFVFDRKSFKLDYYNSSTTE